jgi:hypothetical protein
MSDNTREYEFSSNTIPPVKVRQRADIGHAGCVWDAALVLCAYLESAEGQGRIAGSSCIELGAGTAIVSITASVLGASLSISTDLPLAVALMQSNIDLNEVSASCRAEVLDWTNHNASAFSAKDFDWILCADCVYAPDMVGPILETIYSIGPIKGVIVSNERRDSESNAESERRFHESLCAAGYAPLKVPKSTLRREWRCDDIEVTVYLRTTSN